MTTTELTFRAAVLFFGIGIIAMVIARINVRRSRSGRGRIGFGFRGVGFWPTHGDEIQNFAYAWPVVGWISLGLAALSLIVSLAVHGAVIGGAALGVGGTTIHPRVLALGRRRPMTA